jgi:hypothetical protein
MVSLTILDVEINSSKRKSRKEIIMTHKTGDYWDELVRTSGPTLCDSCGEIFVLEKLPPADQFRDCPNCQKREKWKKQIK